MTFISYAQNFEDVLLWRAFGDLDHGFYIDVGAAHPDIDSVTRAFYDRGWTGINIEPVPEYFVRLTAARPRDVNVNLALGAERGVATLHVVAGSGLSTTDETLADQHRAASWDVRQQDVQIDTLADICRAHAPATIHFLKIDVEGAELAVLQGADFVQFRPQIVLVEATAPNTPTPNHQAWEPTLLAADYRFVWFDGLNRFYTAAERFDELARHFRVPVCYFDNFLRAADTEWTQRVSHAELKAVVAREQTAELLEQMMVADAAVEIAEARAREAAHKARETKARARDAEQRAETAEQRAQSSEHRANAMEARAAAAEHLVRHNEAQHAAQSQRVHAVLQRLQNEEAALRASTSWRLTAPLRRAVETTRGLTGRGRPPAPAPLSAPAELSVDPPAPAAAPAAAYASEPLKRPLRTVHQFHSGSAVGDAITNSLLLVRAQLRLMGYRSDIFVEHCDPLLADALRPATELPVHGEYVLILHHSMGFDAYDRVVALRAPKILMYHNITPPEFFPGEPHIQHMIKRGRDQLAGLRDHVVSALAASQYNAIELRRLGFVDVNACTLLFDVGALRRRASGNQHAADEPFTMLFVGRVVPSKGQLDLLEAFAAFRRIHVGPSRLVLVGRADGAGRAYADEITARARELDLADDVILTGLVSDEALGEHVRQADLYVSLSRHEGFGVPLVEACAAGLPVLAWPAGAVGYTLDVAAGLLVSRDAESVAARMAELAGDPHARAALARAQSAALDRFALPPQLQQLSAALARAGAVPPPAADVAELLAENARYTIAGHVNTTYSLAAINRTLARALDHALPGRVRLEPVEGDPTADLSGVPDRERALTAVLAARPPHETGPVVIISQHYPVYVPQDRGDVLLALVFWEESLLPAATVAVLNTSFDAVLAPSRFVVKAVVDSGVYVPVHMVGYAPELDSFLALPGARIGRPGPFTFLHISSAFPRKGLDVLLAGYARAFRDTDDVRLVIKTFPNPHNDAAARIEALRSADIHAPTIELIDRDVDQDALLALYRDADTVVLPTRGEGFNLPAAEAMAAGVPLVVTGAGGHMDFCTADTVRPVQYRAAVSLSHLAAPTSLWAEPDEDDLMAALREAVADRPASLSRAKRARARITERLDAERMVQAIGIAATSALLYPRAPVLRLCVVTSWDVRCGIAGYSRMLLSAMRSADSKILVTILSDTRAPDGAIADFPVQPVWTLSSTDIDPLLLAFAHQDPHVIMIQHQPGLLGWATLGLLLERASCRQHALLVTLHNTVNLFEVDQDAQKAALSGLAKASRVIVHTLPDLERLRALGLEENVALVPQGAPEPLPALPMRTLDRRSRIIIGCCGFLLPNKGIPTLVEALLVLRREWPKAHLRLCNASYGHPVSGEEAQRVRDAIQATGLKDAIDLVTDYVPFEQARRRVADCDVIVLPYPRSGEAASAALRMAMSAGPCVAVTPIALFEEAGHAAYHLPGTDAESIAAGLDILLSGQDLRENIASAAHDWLEARGWSSVGTRMAGMVRALSIALTAH